MYAKKIRRVATLLLTTVASLTVTVAPVSAQSTGPCTGTVPEPIVELVDLLHLIQRLGVSLALLIAVVMLIFSGILLMRNDPDSAQRARSIIWRVIIGLTVVILAGGIVQVVAETLGCSPGVI